MVSQRSYPQEQHVQEWQSSAIHPSLIQLNLLSLEEEEIAEYYFQYLPRAARRNDGRINECYLRTYSEPLKGGWGVAGLDPTNWDSEPEIRCFKPNSPRFGRDGKPIKYDLPKNAQHYPILPRVSYYIACLVCRNAGHNFLEMCQTYEIAGILSKFEEEAECPCFWQMVLDNPSIPLSITEGVKKQLSLLSQGRCALAVTSIYTWRAGKGSKKIHSWLALFAPNRRFYLTFDQDIKPATVKAVNGQCFKLGTALTKAGAITVKRISWSGTAKGIDDFIFNLSQKYGDRYVTKILRKCYSYARNYRSLKSERELPGKIRLVNKRYLEPSDLESAKNFKILVIKSAKGTNKTGIAADLVAEDRFFGNPTINLSYLERLARELGQRLDLPYRTEENSAWLRNALGYSLCLDSFTPDNSVPFHPDQWRDAGLLIDEFTQVLHYLSCGTTELKHFHKLVLATLGSKLADCWRNNKSIRLLDADANLESIELIYELIQLYSEGEITREELEANTFTLINEYEPAKGDLHFYVEPSPKQIRIDLIERMKRGENLLLVSSSQKSHSNDGTINLEKLALKYYHPSEILRIDRPTTGNPTHPAFAITGESLTKLIKGKNDRPKSEERSPEQLNIFDRGKKAPRPETKQKLNQIKIVIASPTICTGISIDNLDGYFQAVFSFQAGNLTPNSLRQQLVRLRDFQCPRYLWCPKVGKGFVGQKSTNPIEMLTDQKGQGKLTLGLLGFREAEKLIESNICPLTKYWAKAGAKTNAQMYHYREIIAAQLEEEGWNIIYRLPSDDKKALKQVWTERKEIKEASVKEESALTASAQDISQEEADQLLSRRELTENQQAQLDKFNLKQKYGVEKVDPDLIEADSKRLYPALRLKFWLTVGRQYVEQSDRATLEEMTNRSRGQFFLPDFNKKTKITKVKLLEMLRLERFTRPGTQWHNQSPELIELKEFVLKDLMRFNQILGCGIAKTDSPIVVLQKLLALLGEKLVCLRKIRDGEKRLRIYGQAISKLALSHQQEAEIFEYWFNLCQKKFEPLETERV